MENQLPTQGENRADEPTGAITPPPGPSGNTDAAAPAAGGVEALATGGGTAPAAALPPLKPGPVITAAQPQVRAQSRGTIALAMYQEIAPDLRKWGIGLIILGVIQLAITEWQPVSWGSVLILVGLASFLFHEASMYVIYGVTVGWAAFNNLVSGSLAWMGFAAVQIYITVQLFRKFGDYRTARAEYEASLTEEDPTNLAGRDWAAAVFPWIGIALGGLSLASICLLFGVIVYFASQRIGVPTPTVEMVLQLMVSLSILGGSTSLAALLSRYGNRWFSIVGLVANGLCLLVILGLIILGMLTG